MSQLPTIVRLSLASTLALAACGQAQPAVFDPTVADPVAADLPGKSDGLGRVTVDDRQLGRHPFGDAALACEGDQVSFRVSYRPGPLAKGTRVFLHRGLGYDENTWIGDGFCWNSEYVNWQQIQDLPLTPGPDGALVAETTVPASRNLERECQLEPDPTAQYLVELDFVLRIERPDGSVDWDTPDGTGFGSYYKVALDGPEVFSCEVSSPWQPLGAWR